MNPFSYTRAGSVESACQAAAGNGGAKFVAGGTTLVDLLKLNVERPSALIDINGVGLGEIEETPGGGLRIGAMARNSQVAADGRVKEKYPVLTEALLSGASPQLRHMATVGGNLLQRTRCPYFRDGYSACNKRQPGTGCAALAGFNRSHAVLGGSEQCIATFPGDMPVALTALEAVIHTRKTDGTESATPIGDFYISDGDDPARETVLGRGELITAVELPGTDWLRRSVYVKARDRESFNFALASAAVALDVRGNRIESARIALGGVGTKPWRSHLAEEAIAGTEPIAAVYEAVAEAALRDAHPAKHNGFKVELARRTLARALQLASAKRV